LIFIEFSMTKLFNIPNSKDIGSFKIQAQTHFIHHSFCLSFNFHQASMISYIQSNYVDCFNSALLIPCLNCLHEFLSMTSTPHWASSLFNGILGKCQINMSKLLSATLPHHYHYMDGPHKTPRPKSFDHQFFFVFGILPPCKQAT
jgi:hypothetical protein